MPVSVQVSTPARATAASMASRSANGSPPRRRRARSGVALGLRHLARAPGIKRHAVGIARPMSLPVAFGDKRGDLAAALEARIDQTHVFELGHRGLIVVEMLALPADVLLPGDAEPVKIIANGRLVFWPAARGV